MGPKSRARSFSAKGRRSWLPLMNFTASTLGFFAPGESRTKKSARAFSFRRSPAGKTRIFVSSGLDSRDEFVNSGVAAEQDDQASASFGHGMRGGDGFGVHARGLLLVTAFFIDLGEMVADFAVLIEQPGGANVAFGLIEIAFAKIDPAESVPVDADARDLIEIVEREARKLDVAEIRGGGGDGGFGVLRGFIEFEIVLGESVGDVVPDDGRLREFHAFFECFQRFIFFAGVEERVGRG